MNKHEQTRILLELNREDNNRKCVTCKDRYDYMCIYDKCAKCCEKRDCIKHGIDFENKDEIDGQCKLRSLPNMYKCEGCNIHYLSVDVKPEKYTTKCKMNNCKECANNPNYPNSYCFNMRTIGGYYCADCFNYNKSNRSFIGKCISCKPSNKNKKVRLWMCHGCKCLLCHKCRSRTGHANLELQCDVKDCGPCSRGTCNRNKFIDFCAPCFNETVNQE